MGSLKVVMAVVQMMPIIVELVRQLEAIMPEGGQGAAKLAALRELLQGLANVSDDMWPAIETVVRVVVALFNRQGTFATTGYLFNPASVFGENERG